MDLINDLLLNYYFLSFIIAWILSIILKTALSATTKNKLSINDGFKNGGMPSSHSAIVSALTMAIVLKEGFSLLFIITIVFSAIIISDAFRLRRNVGIQGEQLNVLLKKSKEKTIDIVYGHTPLQVTAGIILGVTTAILLFFLI